MSRSKTTSCLSAAVALLVGIAMPAAAQTPRVEISARYQALYDSFIRERFHVGWSGDVAVNINSVWGVVAEASGAHRSDNDLHVDLDLYTLGGGARWSGWRTSRVAPFAQLILGLARTGSSVSLGDSEISVSQTKLMLQPAAGVGVAVDERWSITGQAGYRRILLDGDQDGDTGFNELIVSAGVRVAF